MPIFKSTEEAQKAHEHYHFDTDHEGKFTPRHTGWFRTQQLLDWMPKDEPIFLGIGCNSGGLEALMMREIPGSVGYGLDIQKEMIVKAVKKGVMAKHGHAEELPFKNNYFDVVTLSECLEHFYDDRLVLSEALRVLKPGGLIIGSVPHPRGINAKKRPLEEHAYHTRIYNKKTLGELLKPLKKVEIVDIHFQYEIRAVDDKPQWMAFKGTKFEEK